MTRLFSAITFVAVLAAAAPATAAFRGVPTGQAARVRSSIAQTQQRNNAAIAHVRNSIAATRARQF